MKVVAKDLIYPSFAVAEGVSNERYAVRQGVPFYIYEQDFTASEITLAKSVGALFFRDDAAYEAWLNGERDDGDAVNETDFPTERPDPFLQLRAESVVEEETIEQKIQAIQQTMQQFIQDTGAQPARAIESQERLRADIFERIEQVREEKKQMVELADEIEKRNEALSLLVMGYATRVDKMQGWLEGRSSATDAALKDVKAAVERGAAGFSRLAERVEALERRSFWDWLKRIFSKK